MARGDRRAVKAGKPTVIAMGFIVAIAALAIAGVAWQHFAAGGGDRVVVHAGDGQTYELDLHEDTELKVQTEYGVNVISVHDGAAWVSEADCDNQDCVHQGKIAAPGQQVICLPHRLWVEIVAAGDEGGTMDASAVPGAGDVDVASR